MLTAGPFLYRKEPLQTRRSFGLRTAKCLTTPAQNKKAHVNAVVRAIGVCGIGAAPHSMLPAGAGMQPRVLRGREEDLQEGAVVPRDRKPTPAGGMRCHVPLLPLPYARGVSAANSSF